MDKKIFVTREIPGNGLAMLREKGFVLDIFPGENPPSQEELISHLKTTPYDGIVSLLTDTIDAAVFDAAPTVKIVANYATGFNNVDIEEAKKRAVTVTNTPGVSAQSVAEHTVALILALTTRLVEGDEFIREGKFTGWSPTNFIGQDLSGKTIGLVGVGNIGAAVARILKKGFDAEIIYFDVNKNEQVENDCKAVRCDTIEEILRAADIVSLHVPLLDSTHHLINESRLKLMKPTALLVNTSRGPVIDEVALVAALQNKTIAGAGLDVFEFEPKLSAGLADLPNVVLTPHIASARQSARDLMSRLVAENLIDFFDGKTPANKVT